MAIAPLDHSNVKAYFDTETRIAHITYIGQLSGETSTVAYDWLTDLTEAIGIENLYGEIFDFRQVTEFMPDNLMVARRKSRRRNMRNNVKQLPVAMLVKDFFQEEILRGPMQNPQTNPRKTIVRDAEAGVQFLHDWHAKNKKA